MKVLCQEKFYLRFFFPNQLISKLIFLSFIISLYSLIKMQSARMLLARKLCQKWYNMEKTYSYMCHIVRLDVAANGRHGTQANGRHGTPAKRWNGTPANGRH